MDVLTIGPGSGIGSAILLIIKSLIYKKIFNRSSTLYIDTRISCPPVKMYLHKFIHLVKPGEVEFIGHDVRNKNEFFDTTKVIDGLSHVDPTQKLELCRYYFNRHFQLQSWVLDLLKADPTVCDTYDCSIMIRRGCKPTLEPDTKLTPITSYLKYIDAHSYKKIFVASDDISVFNTLKQMRPDLELYSCLKETDKGFYMWEAMKWDEKYTREHIIKFCKELSVLSRTPETMSDPGSNVLAITLYMRTSPPETLVIDVDLHPTFKWNTDPYFV